MKRILISLIVYLLLSGCGRFVTSPHTPHFQESKITFTFPLRLTSGDIGFLKPHLLLDKKGFLYAVWIDGVTTYIAKSSDEGKTWDKQIVSSGKQRSYDWWPFCFNSDSQGKLYLVQAPGSIDYGIFFSFSEDGGRTWTDPVRVNDDTRKFACPERPSFTINDKGTLFIIYTKQKRFEEIDPWKKEKKAGLYLAQSFDGGDTWSKNVLLKDITFTSPIDFPSLLSYKNILYLAYGNSIYKSKDMGQNWKRILRLKSKFGNIKIVMKSDTQGNLYIIWQRAVVTKDETGIFGGGKKTGFVDICFSKSVNGGRTWTHPVHINDTKLLFEWKMAPINITGTEKMKYLTQETRKAVLFDLAVSENGEVIGAIWKDWRDGKGSLYFSYSLDGGKSWAENVRINDDSTSPMKAGSLIVKDDGSVYVLWTNLGPHKSISGGFIGDVNVYFSSGNIAD